MGQRPWPSREWFGDTRGGQSSRPNVPGPTSTSDMKGSHTMGLTGEEFDDTDFLGIAERTKVSRTVVTRFVKQAVRQGQGLVLPV